MAPFWTQKRFDIGRHLTYAGLERIFQNGIDPWHYERSLYEQMRFAKLLALVRTVPHARVLEVGCAEGHFTERLLTISRSVTAIDLSSEAIARARVRAPGARFLTLNVEEMPVTEERYDVIICAEMLYYVECIEALIAKLRQIGTHLITSTCYPSALRIDAQLASCRSLTLKKRIFFVRVRELKATSLRLWEL
jgi:2-polyprenyl-3-methyl-5-hydroxy-6-metoxy-1,4-benzoquinol methylase